MHRCWRSFFTGVFGHYGFALITTARSARTTPSRAPSSLKVMAVRFCKAAGSASAQNVTARLFSDADSGLGRELHPQRRCVAGLPDTRTAASAPSSPSPAPKREDRQCRPRTQRGQDRKLRPLHRHDDFPLGLLRGRRSLDRSHQAPSRLRREVGVSKQKRRSPPRRRLRLTRLSETVLLFQEKANNRGLLLPSLLLNLPPVFRVKF